jgi:hypothetical protein
MNYSFIKDVFLFSSTKSENRRAEQVLSGGWGKKKRDGWHRWKWEGGGEGDRSVNTMQKRCIHVYVNSKMIPVELCQESGDKGHKVEMQR